MLAPLSWIKEYVEPNLDLATLVAKLNASGTSVERVFSIGQKTDDLVVGEVLEVYPHPKADRLRLAKVDAGQGPVEVVCGATNLAAGQKIVFAKPGSYIPVDMHNPNRSGFTLETATIRGVVSNGMICSAAEMGLGSDHDGIYVLPQDSPVGKPIPEVLNLPQIVLDLEVTSNRSDELSMIGLAREVATIAHQPLTLPKATGQSPIIGKNLKIEPIIQTPDCYRLITQALKVTVGPSPRWMQQYLELAGMRPINNVVDITNFVMLEYGQPLHAYDLDQLQGQSLIVRPAQAEETITTLDGQQRQLSPDIMVIADQDKAIGIAGLMGGQASRTNQETTTIVLEAAVFSPVAVRRAANQLALRSEASKRFERTVDREMTEIAFLRAVDLLVEHAQGKAMGPKRQLYPVPSENKQLTLRSTKLFQYLGRSINPIEVKEILRSLGFKDASVIGKNNDWTLTVWVPSWRRHDVEGEEDLIEEVARQIGYDQLPTQLPSGQLTDLPLNSAWRRKKHLRQQLVQSGWTETMSISLVGEDLHQKIGQPLPEVKVSNPLSSEWTHLRHSLLPSLINIVASNQSHFANQPLQLFELSNIYQATDSLPEQRCHLGLAYYHPQLSEVHVAQVKGQIIELISQLGLNSDQLTFTTAQQSQPPFSADHLNIEYQEQLIGHLGTLSAEACHQLSLPKHLLLAELDLQEFLSGNLPALQFTPPSHYPSLEEDISLLMDEAQPIGPIIQQIKEAGQPLLGSVALTSIYRHPSLGSDKKSPLLHLSYSHPDKTLSNQDIAPLRQKIEQTLNKLGVTTRS